MKKSSHWSRDRSLPIVLGGRYSASQGSRPEENTGGVCWLRRAIRLLLYLERSIYCDLGNVKRIVEL